MIQIPNAPPAPDNGGAGEESLTPPLSGATGAIGGRARPPWPAAVAALIAFAALALSCGAAVPLAGLALGMLASYAFRARYENVTLTKWTLRIIVCGGAVFGYLVTATKDQNSFLDMRYFYSFALMMASEIVLQFWRREPTGGPRAPLLVVLSALVFLAGCSTFDDAYHYLWYMAPAYFLFFTLALPNFRPQAVIPVGLTLVPILIALSLGAATHAGFYIYRGDLNALGSKFLSGKNSSVSMGMSGQPLLGSSFTLRDSLTRVLRIQNLGDDPYLRGMTFDTYSSRAWSPSLEQRKFLPYRVAEPNPPASGDPSLLGKGKKLLLTPPSLTGKGAGGLGSSLTARIVRMDDAIGLLFTPLHSGAVRPEENHLLEWAADSAGPLRTQATDTDPLTYDVIPGQGIFDAPPTHSERERDLAIPPDIDRRVLAKAREFGSGLTDSEAKISAVQKFLLQNNAYSLTVNAGSGEPISSFILQRKSAHCEYFASAAVILLRALHVPTRYVSGYFAHESDGKGWTLVRQRDAHAWAESWVDGVGWVTVDATPGNGRPDQLAGPIPVWWRIWEKLQDLLGWTRNWLVTSSWTEKSVVFCVLILGLLLPQLYRWWQRRKLAALGFQYSRPDAALAALAARFEALLTRRGLPCPEGRTWREHLRVVEEKEELRLPPLEDFVREYGQARFGQAPGGEEIARLDAELRVMERNGA